MLYRSPVSETVRVIDYRGMSVTNGATFQINLILRSLPSWKATHQLAYRTDRIGD